MFVSTPSSSTCVTLLPFQKDHKQRRLHVTAQSLRDEGRSSNVVDSKNMKVLKDRIEVMRAKERLERTHHRPDGWDYTSKYVNKRREKQPGHLQTLALVCGPSSLSILLGTVLLCAFSIIVHLKL